MDGITYIPAESPSPPLRLPHERKTVYLPCLRRERYTVLRVLAPLLCRAAHPIASNLSFIGSSSKRMIRPPP